MLRNKSTTSGISNGGSSNAGVAAAISHNHPLGSTMKSVGSNKTDGSRGGAIPLGKGTIGGSSNGSEKKKISSKVSVEHQSDEFARDNNE